MQINSKKLVYKFKKSSCISFALFVFVIMGAGCATHRHHEDRGPYIKIQGGEDKGGVTWSK